MSTKWMYSATLIIALFLAFYFYQKYRVAPTINLNSLVLSDLEGSRFQMDRFMGKKVIVCFGASWCGNCIEELGILSEIKQKDLADIEIVVISDESLEKIKRFKSKKEYPFTFVKLEGPFNSLGIQSIPTTYLVNTKLTVVKETVGYMNWEDASTLAHYKKLMD